MRTGAVVALKPLRSAKTRLRELPAPFRQHVAWCLASDTIAALAAAVDEVLVVSNEPSLAARLGALGAHVRIRPEGPPLGMNAALAAGAAELDAAGMDLVLACVGDLPCLRPATVRRLLEAAADHPRSFVADATGTGTTMLIARGVSLDPRFQGPSASAHAGSGAHPLTEAEAGPLADARRDVDTPADLEDAVRVGLGPMTATLVDRDTHRLGRFQPVTLGPDHEGRTVALAADGGRYRVDPGTVGGAQTTPGQRLHAALAGDRVLAVWS